MRRRCGSVVTLVLALLLASRLPASGKTIEVRFESYDGYPMFGKLILPDTEGSHPVVVYVQTAEGTTVDMKRRLGANRTFNYYDVYRTKLVEANIGFFSYEGRGITNGDAPPRYEKIDWPVYNTSTLENKIRDVVAAVHAVQRQAGVDRSRIFLIGTSEGSLLAVESASRMPKEIHGVAVYGVMAANLREEFTYAIEDGTFVRLRTSFDTDHDGRISSGEFDADPARLRRLMPQETFSQWDRDGDGFYTADEHRLNNGTMKKAVDGDDFDTLQAWARRAAALAIPDGWFKDHFAHPAMWTFVSALEMPVGFFHGEADINTSIAYVRQMEERGAQAGKKNLSFQYFEGLDHSLNIVQYFARGELPAGHKAIFEFIIHHAK